MSSNTDLATVDTRPYFEQVLRYGLSQRLIDSERLTAIRREGAKGIVQLAGFFGTANLRPELEAARTRLVTLVSLTLESASGGKLGPAAELLRQKSLLSLSKAGADALRVLLRLPEDLILEPAHALPQVEKQMLSLWTLDEPMTHARYQEERNRRESILAQHELSYWLAGKLGVARKELQMNESCEAVINSALLVLFVDRKPKKLFSAGQFIELHAVACRKKKQDFPALDEWSKEAPSAIEGALREAQENFLANILPTLRRHAAADFIPREDVGALAGVFFFNNSGLDELTHHDQETEDAWRKITGGKGEHPDVMCTVLLMVATGLEPRPALRKKDAVSIRENFRSRGFDEAAVAEFIQRVVPFQYQSDVRHLWAEDLGPEARVELNDEDEDHVLAYLHDTCRATYRLS
ncbi:hypothetical protein PA01_18995 [Azoarcus sp. PA01]|nr:hypothetical protein PA01_18995 [Azoarcus sp. PA01]